MDSPSETLIYPCPKCRQSRKELEAPCSNCNWDPNAIPSLETNPEFATNSSWKPQVIFVLSIITGFGFLLGGLMFLLLAGYLGLQNKSMVFLLAPLVQMGMGGLAIYSGILSKHKSPWASRLLVISIGVAILNSLILLWKMTSLTGFSH